MASNAVSGIDFRFLNTSSLMYFNDDNAAQKNLEIMAYIIADAVALFISLV